MSITHPIYSVVSPLSNNQFIISYFWRNKNYCIQNNEGTTYFFTITANNSVELNEEITKQFQAEYLRGTFDNYLQGLNIDFNSDKLVIKTNNFVVSAERKEIVLNSILLSPLSELIFSN